LCREPHAEQPKRIVGELLSQQPGAEQEPQGRGGNLDDRDQRQQEEWDSEAQEVAELAKLRPDRTQGFG